MHHKFAISDNKLLLNEAIIGQDRPAQKTMKSFCDQRSQQSFQKNLIHYGNDCLDARLNMNTKKIILVAVAIINNNSTDRIVVGAKRQLHLPTISNADETVRKIKTSL